MANPRTLEGKLAIVTGASRGIGAAICENLAKKGCSLLMNYTSQSSTQKVTDLASALGQTHNVRTAHFQADLGELDCGQELLDAAKHMLSSSDGSLKVDIIVNNAGVAGNQELGHITSEMFHKLYNVNVLGPIMVMQSFLPYLPHDGSGRIVNLSSVSSSLGFFGQSVYGGTKAALEAMTRTWSRELSGRATVNAVNPGPVATDMYGGNSDTFVRRMKPWNTVAPRAEVSKEMDGEEAVAEVEKTGGRPAAPGEIAGVVAMLCSAESSWCTGSVICANGGMRFSP
ncbi:MAG: hypothetical protein M1828_007128 [Chrysothrix sp. TS-e1954]|nr:MAG: hypothetical protein M1828_007128 [Chrysothrix sp. TS-e1954]